MEVTELLSNDFNCIPKAGGCTIAAYFIPSTLWSIPNMGFPVTILVPSTFFLEFPMILKSEISFNLTVSGSGASIVPAKEAISP